MGHCTASHCPYDIIDPCENCEFYDDYIDDDDWPYDSDDDDE